MTRTGSHPLDPVRTHRRLVRLGYALLAAGPVLALAHLINDTQSTDAAWWTYTVASYDIALIIVMAAVALILRNPPASGTDHRDTAP
ncbi:hypothetical protein LG322_14300 [Microbacterium aerolatum]|uniref:hypothetical protein n=1 Tax=Microbacterium aerolatum TaxID=153731 RepID=UPI00385057EE